MKIQSITFASGSEWVKIMMMEGIVATAITPPIKYMIRRGLCISAGPNSQPVNTVAPIPATRCIGPVMCPASPALRP